jgi:hypothetical protein
LPNLKQKYQFTVWITTSLDSTDSDGVGTELGVGQVSKFSSFKLSKFSFSKLSKFHFSNCQKFRFPNCQNFLFQTVKISFFKLSNFLFSKLSKFHFPNCQNFLFKLSKFSFSKLSKFSFSKLSKYLLKNSFYPQIHLSAIPIRNRTPHRPTKEFYSISKAPTKDKQKKVNNLLI